MGYIRHRLLITQLPVLEPTRSEVLGQFETWRKNLPDDWQRLIIGPVLSIANDDEWIVFLPDGSKEGWEPSKQGYAYAQEFIRLLDPYALEVTWGDDDAAIQVGLSWGDDG